MQPFTAFVRALAGGLLLLSATAAFSQDWPQWRGANRDGKVAGFTAPQAWPAAFMQKWKISVGAGDATPALVGDKLYVFTRQGDEEVIRCVKAGDGAVVWEDKYATPAVTGPASRHNGPRSTPTVAEGKVIILGACGILSCLNAADGKLLWRKDEYPKIVPTFYTAMSPLVVDGLVIAQLGGKAQGGIIAYTLATGEVKWRWTEEGPEYASPALLTVDGVKQLVTLTEKSIVGINVADGKLLWKLPFVPQGRAYNAATPIIDGQTVIFTGSGRGTKAITIEKQGETFATKEMWSIPDLAVQYNTPVLKDGLLYGLSDKGNLFCINAKTGKTAWTDTVVRDRGGFGAMLDAGTVMLALPSSGDLTVFTPSEAAYTEVAKIKVTETPTYAFPIISEKRIFVKDQDSLILWTLE